MTQKGNASRERITAIANNLIYTKGYNQTSVAEVADAVGITKGNLNYHFRSKDDLLQAVIANRITTIIATLQQWDHDYPQAKSKLKRFVQMLRSEEESIVRYGCPMGSLNVELGKDQLPLKDKAWQMFDLYQKWLAKIFVQLGYKNSKSMSKHLLVMAQGAALMSYIYSDKKLLREECDRIEEWIDSI